MGVEGRGREKAGHTLPFGLRSGYWALNPASEPSRPHSVPPQQALRFQQDGSLSSCPLPLPTREEGSWAQGWLAVVGWLQGPQLLSSLSSLN